MNANPKTPPALDAWVLARALAGHAVNGELSKVSMANRSIAERLATAAIAERKAVWDEHIASFDDSEADVLIEAVATVGPDDPEPEDDSWGHPCIAKSLPVEPFPVEVYPYAVARLVDSGAKAIGCPPDFFGLPILPVAGAAIGRSVSLLLKENYFASASIFAANIGLPGDGKSPALDVVVKPLDEIDQVFAREYAEEMVTYEDCLAKFEAESRTQPGGRGSKGRRAKDNETDEDVAGSSESAIKPTPPVLRRNVVRDTTTEALDQIMASNPRGLIQVLDEASSLVSSMNQYRGGKGSDRQWYLSTWSNQARTVDRKQNQNQVPTRIDQPFLCFIGGLVPDMVAELREGHGRHDGFLDRFLFAYPDQVPKPPWSNQGIPESVIAEWAEVIRRLREVPMILHEDRPVPRVVRFTPEASAVWEKLINSHRAEQSSADFPESMTGPSAKLEQYAGRITLILHMLHWVCDSNRDPGTIPDVGPDRVRDAARLLEYFKSHIRRVHTAMKAGPGPEHGNDDVQSILKWIFRHQPESFSVRDLRRDLSRTFGKRSQELEVAIGLLVSKKCIRPQAEASPKEGRPGRRRSPVYLVNPRLVASQNRQNQPEVDDTADQNMISDDSVNSATAARDDDGKEGSNGHQRRAY